MIVESFMLTYFKNQAKGKALNTPHMPTKGNQKMLEAIRDQTIADATEYQAKAGEAVLNALNEVRTSWPELDKDLARLDKEILACQNDMAKRPKAGPAVKAMISFAKNVGLHHITTLIETCDDEADLMALLSVLESEGRDSEAKQVMAHINKKLVGYDAVAKLAALEEEKRGAISYVTQLQEQHVLAIASSFGLNIQAARNVQMGLA